MTDKNEFATTIEKARTIAMQCIEQCAKQCDETSDCSPVLLLSRDVSVKIIDLLNKAEQINSELTQLQIIMGQCAEAIGRPAYTDHDGKTHNHPIYERLPEILEEHYSTY